MGAGFPNDELSVPGVLHQSHEEANTDKDDSCVKPKPLKSASESNNSRENCSKFQVKKTFIEPAFVMPPPDFQILQSHTFVENTSDGKLANKDIKEEFEVIETAPKISKTVFELELSIQSDPDPDWEPAELEEHKMWNEENEDCIAQMNEVFERELNYEPGQFDDADED